MTAAARPDEPLGVVDGAHVLVQRPVVADGADEAAPLDLGALLGGLDGERGRLGARPPCAAGTGRRTGTLSILAPAPDITTRRSAARSAGVGVVGLVAELDEAGVVEIVQELCAAGSTPAASPTAAVVVVVTAGVDRWPGVGGGSTRGGCRPRSSPAWPAGRPGRSAAPSGRGSPPPGRSAGRRRRPGWPAPSRSVTVTVPA